MGGEFKPKVSFAPHGFSDDVVKLEPTKKKKQRETLLKGVD
ncbi:hypothetical protein CCACVL1_23611 [Corchorus capsularis]|uniref:Uncharacterized protein n=1 Tax=Corchorus capsularis TaxID=210143 RepID=A0A1R3GTD9_COCAP|nr:hypothetical protein CCACVL1_23611 [Corchorus capsularis]